MVTNLERRLAKAERESQADENCDWLYLQLRALDGDEAARAKTERAARERWPCFERFWVPSSPEGRTTSRTSWRQPMRQMRRVWVAHAPRALD
jgi:hypothetical protein